MKPGLIRRWRTAPRATLGQRLRQLAMAVGLATVLSPLTLAAPVRPADIQRGEYLARLGDCVACHTAERGQPMAGGRALQTPFGTLYSTNITPDRATGIGGYSFAQFDRAMRQGVAADGHNLYPAMPYPSYAKMTADDMQALYAYLMQGLKPVSQVNKPTDMRWPFSLRWGLSLWNWAFLDTTPSRYGWPLLSAIRKPPCTLHYC